MADTTEATETATTARDDLDATVHDFVRNRAAIEQAKGMLMLIYGISTERAFEVLRWQSQNTNVKVRDLAARAAQQFTTHLSIDATVQDKADHLLLTAPHHVGVPGDDSMAEPAPHQALPDLLRRAIAFIDNHLADDIGIDDIAQAVFISPRAVQMTFRRHLNLTPMEFLRQSRLERAHHHLLIANPQAVTIQEVASTWRFGHSGRFAMTYRAKYGQSPKDTLRTTPAETT